MKFFFKYTKFFPYIFHIIYFNFHYLPFKHAIKLPILLYRPKLLRTKGIVILDSDRIKFGMIRLGEFRVSLYPSSGITWENWGGKVIFKGTCNIGNASAISVGTSGVLSFGNNFSSTAAFRIACYHSIEFNENVLFAWENIVVDTDFHKTKMIDTYLENKGFAPVRIGANNWFGLRCLTLKGTETPDFTIVAANSILNKKYNTPIYSVLAGSPASLKFTGIYLDRNDDILDYTQV
ncbi:MAG: hypothetical protein IT249_12245 [Chitinophagaceae bacterium]|nr:hypothetical protein [Chitinophagaceae bacterium]